MLLIAASSGAHAFGLESVLEGLGIDTSKVQWSGAQRDGATWTLADLQAPGIRARRVSIALGAPPQIELVDVHLDPADLIKQRTRRDAPPVPLSIEDDIEPPAELEAPRELEFAPWLLDVTARGLRMSWRGREILRADGARLVDGQLTVTGKMVSGTADLREPTHVFAVGSLNLGWMKARVEAGFAKGAEWPVKLRLRQLSLRGSYVGEEPLHLPGLDFQLRRAPTHWHGQIGLGAALVNLQAACPGSGCFVQAHLDDTPIAALLRDIEAFIRLPAVPRAHGTLNARASYQLPNGPLTLDAALQKFEVTNTGVDIGKLSGGMFEHPVHEADGGVRQRTTGDDALDWIALADIAPVLPTALKAAEDWRFDTHAGFDMRAIVEVVHDAVNEGRRWRGASTLTQQLTKNLYLNPRDRSLHRKLQELLIAVELDRRLGKARQMELYLNVVEWAPGLRGIGPAAAYYLGKDPFDLTLAEAAWLVTALPSPRRFHKAWERDTNRQKQRTERILKRLHQRRYIDAETYADAMTEGIPKRCAYWPEQCPEQ
ncbi:MAG: biosynthetic peptidoglycan transglycosylase [Pseudomonadota bacterium]